MVSTVVVECCQLVNWAAQYNLLYSIVNMYKLNTSHS